MLPFREWIREHLPAGSEKVFLDTGGPGGLVVEDLDLVVKIWYEKDRYGKFMLIELKFNDAPLGYSKEQTFGLINHLLRLADPERRNYMGFYVVHYSDSDWEKLDHIRVNGHRLTMDDVKKWLLFEKDIAPWSFPLFSSK